MSDVISYERLIHMLAGCKYLPGTWDKKFVRGLEIQLGKSEFKLSDAQIAQLRRIAWEKRKSLRVMGFDPPVEWRGETPERMANTKEKIKLELWKRAVENGKRDE